MIKRVLTVVAVAVLAAGAAAYALRPERGASEGGPAMAEMATSVGAPVMEHLYRGHVPGRSGEIMLVPKPHHYLIGRWDLRTFLTDEPMLVTSHPNPWDYLARVPIALYGPGYVPRAKQVRAPVDIAAFAPTYAAMLGMDDFDAAGDPLPGIPPVRDGRGPKVIFTVVIDGGGWNVLQEHPESWPNIRRLFDEGTLYLNGTIGSAPSITGALHATFGTGYYPKEHGIPGNQMRGTDGRNVDAWLQNADPRFLKKPTVSELWDERNGNRPIIGTVSYEGWHLGMIGHGAARPQGDKDIAVLWEIDDNEWWINEEFYELPDYLLPTDIDKLEAYEAAMDPRDGIEDGTWFGHTLQELRVPREGAEPEGPKVRPGTPAFTRFTGDAVVEVMRKEGLGRDDVTDLFWVEMKMPDFGGHAWNMVGPEQADILQETDTQIGRFKKLLDETAGKGNYVFALSADHGQQPLPEPHGGWRIVSPELQRDIEARFGRVVEKLTPVDIYVDHEALRDRGVTLEEIASFLGAYTIGDNLPDGAPGADRVPQALLDDRVFAGAFTTDYLQSLGGKTERFGEGDYPEGSLPITDPAKPEG